MVKLLSMFSSNHDGEVTNAARAAFRLLQANKLSWSDVLASSADVPSYDAYSTAFHAYAQKPRAYSYKPPADPEHWAEVKSCQDNSGLWTDWEKEFLDSLAKRTHPLTEKQRARLDQMKAKAEKYKDMTW